MIEKIVPRRSDNYSELSQKAMIDRETKETFRSNYQLKSVIIKLRPSTGSPSLFVLVGVLCTGSIKYYNA